jgi:membrane protein implicated in regulation of membrane protease activity
MQARATPSPADVASELNDLLAGVGILTMALFPFAVPVLVLVIAPLALVAVAGLLLAIPFVLPLWLVRMVVRSRSRRRGARASAER